MPLLSSLFKLSKQVWRDSSMSTRGESEKNSSAPLKSVPFTEKLLGLRKSNCGNSRQYHEWANVEPKK